MVVLCSAILRGNAFLEFTGSIVVKYRDVAVLCLKA